MRLITFTDGHQIYSDAYHNLREYFKKEILKYSPSCIETIEIPTKETDYAFSTYNLYTLPRELITVFGKAGLKTKFENNIIKLKY